MKLYYAPLEGITTYTYRAVHHRFFPECDGYYAPFITPDNSQKANIKEMRDILPQNNIFALPKVQFLSCDAKCLVQFAKYVEQMGYDEINLNFGCPSSTVVKKGRGAGFLQYPDRIDRFLYEVFGALNMKISVKTRIGFSSADEAHGLMQIYSKYPLNLLIVHPRTRADYYNGEPNYETFGKIYTAYKGNLCYNGNIFSKADFDAIMQKYEGLHSVMIGRGAVANPAIFREIKGGMPLCREELLEFGHALAQSYLERLGSETFTLHKLKEIWLYVMQNYPEEKKILKQIKKSTRLADFFVAVEALPEPVNAM